jgi:hypothetical protein
MPDGSLTTNRKSRRAGGTGHGLDYDSYSFDQEGRQALHYGALPSQYASYIRFIMSTHTSQINDIINTSGRLIDALDDAFKDLQASDKMPTLRECQNKFTKALVVYRDSVLKDVLSHTLSTSSESNQSKLGRAAEWGSKKPWTKTKQSVGTSSKMSVASAKDDGIVQRLADDDVGGSTLPERDTTLIVDTAPDGYDTVTPGATEGVEPGPATKKKVTRNVRKKIPGKERAPSKEHQARTTLLSKNLCATSDPKTLMFRLNARWISYDEQEVKASRKREELQFLCEQFTSFLNLLHSNKESARWM